MTPKLKCAAVILAVVTVAGCTSRELEQARSTRPQGTAFDQALAKHYVALSEVEYRQNDTRDGYTYARRATHTAEGKALQPDDFTNRRLSSKEKGELQSARQRLVAALDRNGRTSRPDVAARAQVLFDCWVEQQEEDIQPDHIAACRDGFSRELAELEKAPPPVAAKPPIAAPEKHLVFFDWDKATLNADARKTIADAAQEAKTKGSARIIATGHADRSGPPQYNQRLSERRAAAVKGELVRLGIPANQIVTSGRGESEPAVPTADGVREVKNRRVEIVMQ